MLKNRHILTKIPLLTLSFCLLTNIISIYITNPLYAQEQQELTIEKFVDKEHVQRDDPAIDAQLVTYTLNIATNGYCNNPLDIAIAFDKSGSMAGENLTTSKQASIAFINEMDEANDLVSLVSYSTIAALDEPLTNNFQQIINTINSIVAEGSTNIGDSLTLSRDELVTNGRTSVQKVILLMTDGLVTVGPNPEPIAESIKNNDGIRIISVGIGDNVDELLLESIASGPDDLYLIADLEDLEQTLIDIAYDLQYEDTQIIVNDNISEILKYADLVSVSNSGYFDSESITWDLGVDPCDNNVQLNFMVEVKNNAPDLSKLINSANVLDLGSELTDSSNIVMTLVHAPNLSISKSSGWNQVTPGTEINYSIYVANKGTGNAYNVTITDNLPDKYFNVFEDSISDNGSIINNSIVWNNNGLNYILDGSFSPTNSINSLGSEHTFIYSGQINPNCPSGEKVINTVILTAKNKIDYSIEATNTVKIGDVLAATGDFIFREIFFIGLASLICIITIITLGEVNKKHF